MKIFQGDIVWVAFPFTGGTSSKERPALVLSNDRYNQSSLDLLLCYITSQKEGEYLIPILDRDLSEGHLPIQSYIRYDKIILTDRTRVLGSIAVVKRIFYRKAVRAICDFIELRKQ